VKCHQHAIGVSSARSARGTFAGAAARAAEAIVSFAGHLWSANPNCGRGSGRPARSLSGHRRLQTHRRSGATGSGHSRGSDLAYERSRSLAAGSFAAVVTIRECLGTRLVVGGAGATFRLRCGGVGATVRSQCELGRTAAGSSRSAARRRAAASAHGRDLRPGSDEVLGAGGGCQPGGLPHHGRRFCSAQVHQPASRAVVCRLARGLAQDPATDSRTAGVVLEGAAAGRAPVCFLCDPGSFARSGNDRCPRAAGSAAAAECPRRRRADDGGTERASATPARACPGSAGSSGGQNPTPSQTGKSTRRGRTLC
jgi:hypothetical protein